MRTAWGLVVLTLLAPGCSSSGEGVASPTATPEPSRSIRTLTPISMPPEPPPTGRLRADMRQSSRDAAAGRMEVWVDNDTARGLTPTRITYSDPRFSTEIEATRLRAIPSQSERGFPILLPSLPACDHPAGRGTVTIEYADQVRVQRVADTTDVTGRYTTARCTELAVAQVADLAWDDVVAFDGQEGDPGTLTLVITPTGRAGPALSIDAVSGTPVLAPVDGDVWRPGVTVRGTDQPSRVDLPVKPNRCDAHAFAESGGATAFKIALHLDDRPGLITLRMSIPGAASAIDFARASCGSLDTVYGGG